jgi:hypothetical protein
MRTKGREMKAMSKGADSPVLLAAAKNPKEVL